MNFAVEKAFDIVMDALIEKSKDEIDDILQQSKRKKMLQKTFESFMGHALANTEYSKLAYVNSSESIAALNEEELDPSQDTQKLKDYILPVVQQTFVTDEDIDWNRLSLYLRNIINSELKLQFKYMRSPVSFKEPKIACYKKSGKFRQLLKRMNRPKGEQKHKKNCIIESLFSVK